MFVNKSKNCERTEIRTKINLYCIDLGNPKCQRGANKCYYYKTVKFTLKMLCLANFCRKVCDGLVTKYLIAESWAAKICLLKELNANLSADNQNGC